MDTIKEKKRHFGGELFVFVDYKDPQKSKGQRIIRNLEKKHLKAYLRGDKKFSFGLDMHGHPMWYFVKEVWK